MSVPELVIEKVTPESFHELERLILELARFEKLTPPDQDGFARMREHAFQREPYFVSYLAWYEGQAIGYIIYFFTYSSFKAKPTLFLEDIFVLESHRGKGFGKKMFLFVVEKAREKGCGRMEWSALNWNKRAIDLYLSMGAKPLDEWTFFRMDEGTIDRLSKRD